MNENDYTKQRYGIRRSLPIIDEPISNTLFHRTSGNVHGRRIIQQSEPDISTYLHSSSPTKRLLLADVFSCSCQLGMSAEAVKRKKYVESEESEKASVVVPDQVKQGRSVGFMEHLMSFFQPSDNKLTMKLFGNKSALDKEKQRQKEEGKWIIHPCSKFRYYWDIVMLMLLIANLIILPVAISFFNDDLSLRWIIFNCISDTIFLLDIAVNFRTGIIMDDHADEIILVSSEIAKKYMRSWFFLDFISSLPIDYIFLILNRNTKHGQVYSAGRALRMLRLAKVLSLIRLLRITRLIRYVAQWEEILNIANKFMRIFNLILLMILLGHWNACFQFLVPMLSDFPTECWVVKCNLKSSPFLDQYTWAVFKAMSHMLGMGYGRFPPTSVAEAWVTILSVITGSTCYAMFVGHAAALIQSFDTSKRLYREKFKQVEEYMTYRKIPRPLRQKITNYYEYRYQGKMFDETELLKELSECLREEVANYNCRGLVAAVPFFNNADPNFVEEVVVKLEYEVYQPGDIVIKVGSIGTKMYFIQEGIVDIISKNGDIITTLSDGCYFGEICLMSHMRRVASVRARTYCHLYSLNRETFLEVLDNYPLMRQTMEGVAAERLSALKTNSTSKKNSETTEEDIELFKNMVMSCQTDKDEIDYDEIIKSKKEKLNRKTRFDDEEPDSK